MKQKLTELKGEFNYWIGYSLTDRTTRHKEIEDQNNSINQLHLIEIHITTPNNIIHILLKCT